MKTLFTCFLLLTEMSEINKTSMESAASPASLLQEASLRELIAAGVVTGLVARAESAGFVIDIGIGERKAILGNVRGQPRLFASMETIATLLLRLGYPVFQVDATRFVPGRVRAARPDRSEAMKSVKLQPKNRESQK